MARAASEVYRRREKREKKETIVNKKSRKVSYQEHQTSLSSTESPKNQNETVQRNKTAKRKTNKQHAQREYNVAGRFALSATEKKINRRETSLTQPHATPMLYNVKRPRIRTPIIMIELEVGERNQVNEWAMTSSLIRCQSGLHS